MMLWQQPLTPPSRTLNNGNVNVKALLWFAAAAATLLLLIGIWTINNQFVADTLEATFDNRPQEGWRYWYWRESWPAFALGVIPAALATIYCLAKAVSALKRG